MKKKRKSLKRRSFTVYLSMICLLVICLFYLSDINREQQRAVFFIARSGHFGKNSFLFRKYKLHFLTILILFNCIHFSLLGFFLFLVKLISRIVIQFSLKNYLPIYGYMNLYTWLKRYPEHLHCCYQYIQSI